MELTFLVKTEWDSKELQDSASNCSSALAFLKHSNFTSPQLLTIIIEYFFLFSVLTAFLVQVVVTFLRSAPRCLFRITLSDPPRYQPSRVSDIEEGKMVEMAIINATKMTHLLKTSYT